MRGRTRALARLVALACSSAAETAFAANAVEKPFAVIVGADVPDRRLTRDSVSLIFRRKQMFWDDGLRIHPVNLPAASPLREAFSRCVIGKPSDAMEEYWREMYFHGVLPPHVVDSEAAVVLFVESTPGAIGYVSACPKDPRVAIVLTVGDVPNCPKHDAGCLPLQGS